MGPPDPKLQYRDMIFDAPTVKCAVCAQAEAVAMKGTARWICPQCDTNGRVWAAKRAHQPWWWRWWPW
jgi:hypothetical protein